MNLGIYIVVGVALAVLGYLYWRQLRQVLDSSFRAYDILFLTILVFYLIGRLGWRIEMEPAAIFSIRGLLDPRVGGYAYLVILYIPLVVYYLATRYLSHNQLWKQHANLVVRFSQIGLIILALSDLGLKLAAGQEINLIALGIAIASAVGVLGMMYRLQQQQKLSHRLVAGLLLVQQILIQLIIWLGSTDSTQHTFLAIFYFVLFGYPALLLVAGERKRQLEPIPYGQFRNPR